MNALTLATLACCTAVPAAAPTAQQGAKPNVLVIVADDWSWPHAGCLGDKVVKTPNFDKFVKGAVLFRRTHCASPSCTPSRGSILTGQMFSRLQEGGNLWSTLQQKYVCYPDLLEQAGYVIGLIGKGWGPGDFTAAGRTRNPAGPTKHKTFAQFLKALPKDRPSPLTGFARRCASRKITATSSMPYCSRNAMSWASRPCRPGGRTICHNPCTPTMKRPFAKRGGSSAGCISMRAIFRRRGRTSA